MRYKKATFLLMVVTLIISTLTFLPGAGNTVKADSSVFTTFITTSGGKLYDGAQEFRFCSVNVPFVDMTEDGENHTWKKLTRWEQEDLVKTVKQMGGQVIRRYALSTKQPGKTYEAHVLGPNQFSETAFQAFDQFLALCNQYGVRVIVPFVDQYNYDWNGGVYSYQAFRGLPTNDDGYAFVTNMQVRDDFKATINYVLNRTNTITGVKYKDDKAIMAWETGNELWCENKNYSWVPDIAAYIKSIDNNHLLIDGDMEASVNSRILQDPAFGKDIDIMSNHMYKWSNGHSDFVAAIKSDMSYTRGKKPYIVGEYGLTNATDIHNLLDTVVSEGVSGCMIWSLRGHREAGGFWQHREGTYPGDGIDYWAYHWPGFAVNDNFWETTIIQDIYQHAYTIRGLTAPPIPIPDPPILLPISNPTQAINWSGSAGAVNYDIQRSTDSSTWATVGSSITDMYKDYSYPPNFKDTTANGSGYYYRVIAKNASGSSAPSNVVLWGTPPNPNLPGAFSQTAPAAGATGVGYTPIFTWGASARATGYSLIVSTNSNYSSPVINVGGLTSTSYTSATTLAANTTYYWKVTATNSYGSVDAGNAGISFTTAPPLPGAFSQTAPANGSTGTSLTPTFTWGASTNASSYTVVVSTSISYANPITNQSGITSTSYTPVVSLAVNTTYYWKVTAINSTGSTTASNSGISFTTGAAPAAVIVDNFEGYGGSNTNLQSAYSRNTDGGALTVTLNTANKIEGSYGMKYDYTINSSPNFAGVTKSLTGANWSGRDSISLWVKPDGSNRTLTIQFKESGSGEMWETYYTLSGTSPVTLQIPFNNFAHPGWYSGGNGVIDIGSIAEYSLYVNQGSGNTGSSTLYFDNVSVVSSGGSPSVPGSFSQNTPASGATGISATPAFTWSASSNATTYALVVSTSSSYSNPVINQSGLTSTSYTPATVLANSTVYYWKVTATNSSGSTTASNAGISFTTATAAPSPAPGSFSQSAPATGATGVSTTPAFTWGVSSNATSYALVVSTSSSYSNPVINQSGISSTSYTPATALANSTIYYWKVTATNSTGSTIASNAGISFVTTASGPSGVLGNNGSGSAGMHTISQNGNGYITACRFQATSSFVVTKMNIKISGNNAPIKLAIYSDNAGSIGSFLMGTEQKTSTVWNWNTFNFTSSLNITSGNYYWLAVWSAYGYNVFYDTGGIQAIKQVNYSESWPSSITGYASETDKLCIYAN